jgi:hypothetical protein
VGWKEDESLFPATYVLNTLLGLTAMVTLVAFLSAVPAHEGGSFDWWPHLWLYYMPLVMYIPIYVVGVATNKLRDLSLHQRAAVETFRGLSADDKSSLGGMAHFVAEIRLCDKHDTRKLLIACQELNAATKSAEAQMRKVVSQADYLHEEINNRTMEKKELVETLRKLV